MHLPTVFSALGLTTPALSACSREVLTTITSLYLSAQTRGSSTQLTPFLAPNSSYMKQFTATNISAPSSIINKAPNPSNALVSLDAHLCRAPTETTTAEQPHAYVLGVRVEGDGKYIPTVETLVRYSDAGGRPFNRNRNCVVGMGSRRGTPFPEAEHDSRETIRAAGDADF